MRARIWQWWNDRSGVSTLEVALVAPVLLLLSVGIIDIGRMWQIESTLRHSANEGARFAAIRGAGSATPATVTDVETFVTNRNAGMDAQNVAIAVLWAPSNASGSLVTVQLSYQLNLFMTSFLSLGPVNINAQSTLVVL